MGALAYDFPALSVQYHPELTEAALRDLFERGRGVLLDGALADAAVDSFREARVPVDLQAAEVATFFRDNA